jgi:phenylpropionate dioxygenase-like ring-hydroxylating dioxygenase large terminal subunit
VTGIAWHLVAHESELLQRHSFVRIDAGGDTEIVAWRDRSDELLVFDGACPHRGTRLFVEDRGCAPLRCPYHGFYRSNGKDVTPADLGLADPLRLQPTQSQWIGRWLFAAAPNRDAPRLRTDLPELMQVGEMVGELHSADRSIWQGPWRSCVENFLDEAHVKLAHGASLATLDLREREVRPTAGGSLYSARIGNERLMDGISKVRKVIGLPADDPAAERYTALFVYPNVLLSSTGGLSLTLQRFVPGAQAGQTVHEVRVYGSRAPRARSAAGLAYLESVRTINARIFAEDRALVERLRKSPGIDARGVPAGSGEPQIKWFREAIDAEAGTR